MLPPAERSQASQRFAKVAMVQQAGQRVALGRCGTEGVDIRLGLDPKGQLRLIDDPTDIIQFEWFLEVVEGALPNGLLGPLERSEAGDQNHFDLRSQRLRFAQQLHAVHFRHRDVGEDDVERPATQQLESRRAVLGRDAPVVAERQGGAENLADLGFVVDDENLGGFGNHLYGDSVALYANRSWNPRRISSGLRPDFRAVSSVSFAPAGSYPVFS